MTHLQLESILAAADDSDGADLPERTEDLDEVFSRLARETSGIQDVDTLTGLLSQEGR